MEALRLTLVNNKPTTNSISLAGHLLEENLRKNGNGFRLCRHREEDQCYKSECAKSMRSGKVIAFMMNSSEFETALNAFVPDISRASGLATWLRYKNVDEMLKFASVSNSTASCSIVISYGGGRDAAVAAVLLEAAEFRGGIETIHKISKEFGKVVGEIVLNCMDSLENPKPLWRERKEKHLQRIGGFDQQTCFVLAADKLANLRSMKYQLRGGNSEFWETLPDGFEGSRWFYQSFIHAIAGRIEESFLRDLQDTFQMVFVDRFVGRRRR